MIPKVSRFRKRKESTLLKKLLGWLFLGLICVAGLFLIFYNVNLYQKRAELEERAKELKLEILELSQQELEFRNQLEVSVTPEYQERVLREQGLYQKEGEEVVTILPLKEPEIEQKKERVWWDPRTWWAR